MKRNLFLYALLCVSFLNADKISVTNHSQTNVNVSLYYVKATILTGVGYGKAERITEVFLLAPGQKVEIVRPKTKFGFNRELLFARNKEDLKLNLTESGYKSMPSKTAGWLQGNTYHLAEDNGRLVGYGDVEWKTIHKIKEAAGKLSDAARKELQKGIFADLPHGKEVARVRQNKNINQKELQSINKRFPKAKNTLEHITGMSFTNNETPRIAVCLSGGSVRAMLCSYGLQQGLQDIGLSDAVLYTAALSGSTWFLAHYTFLGNRSDYNNQFMKAVTERHAFDFNALSKVLWPKYVFDQSTSIVDLYGVWLSNKLFRNLETDLERQMVRLSLSATPSKAVTDLHNETKRRIENGEVTFPIYTMAEISYSHEHPNWYSLTPYEIGSEELGGFVPSWSFGRKFNKGGSTDNAPEQTFGFLLGTCGAALSGSFKQMFEKGASSQIPPAMADVVRKIIRESGLEETAVAPIKVFNPLLNLSSYPKYKNFEKLKFTDGGYAYNLPLLPLFNKTRKVDIVIVLDASETVHEGGQDLKAAETHLKGLGFSFPAIDYTGITSRQISIFSDPHNVDTSVVIYVPPVKNDKYSAAFDPSKEFKTTYGSSKFTYTQAQAEKLIGLIRANIVDNKQSIISTIKERINLKKQG